MPRAYEPTSDEPAWLAFGPLGTDEDLIHQLDALDALVDAPPGYQDPDRPPRPLRLEPGRQAAESLMRVMGDRLIQLMLLPNFEAIDEQDVVPVLPCPYCGDGALRLAGTLLVRQEKELVRSCDTCGSVQLGEALLDPPLR
jgi:hypothetical protein